MPNLPGAKKDCLALRACLEKYQIKESDVVWLGDNPTTTQLGNEIDKISKKLRLGKKARPPESYLVIILFAGHGILKDGMQMLLYNEYDQATGFYKLLKAE